MVTQAGPASPTNVSETFTAVHKTMAKMLGGANGYRVHVPSFGTMWGFIAAGQADATDLTALPAEEIDARIGARLSSPLSYYDGVTHHGLLALPKYIRKAVADETRLITRDNPLYAL